MKDKLNLRYYLLALLFLAGAVFILTKIHHFSTESKNYKIAHAEKYVMWERVTMLGEWSGDINNAENFISEENIVKANEAYAKALDFGYLFIMGAISFLLLIYLFYRKSPLIYKFMTLGLILIGICCLVIGVFSPMMEIVFYNDDLKLPISQMIPENFKGLATMFNVDIDAINPVLEGRTYHSYHHKSIKEVIGLLFERNNIIVGGAILLFSVIFPLTKLFLSMSLILSVKLRNSKAISWIVHNIGKWSMADVFVVGVFLAYFSFSNLDSGTETDSRVLIGLYFFFAYVLISISSTYLLDKTLQTDNKASLIEKINS